MRPSERATARRNVIGGEAETRLVYIPVNIITPDTAMEY